MDCPHCGKDIRTFTPETLLKHLKTKTADAQRRYDRTYDAQRGSQHTSEMERGLSRLKRKKEILDKWQTWTKWVESKIKGK